MYKMSLIYEEELIKHVTAEDLWIAVNGHVYDVTKFLVHHPGTSKPFLEFAGRDATEGFNKNHPKLDISRIPLVVMMGEFVENVN